MRLLPFEYATRNLLRSPLRFALSAGGSLLVVLLALGAGAFVRGMDRSLADSGSAGNVILLGAGSEESVERSEIRPDVAGQVAASLGGIRSRLGVAYISPEVHLATALKGSAESQRQMQALLRGVTASAFLVHPRLRIIEGRAPTPGRDEILVGRLAGTRLGLAEERLAPGRQLWFDNRLWTISGRFEAPGTVLEAEIWCPLTDLQIAAKRDNLSCVILTLEEGADFADVDVFCKTRLDLELVALRESDYYARLRSFYRPVQVMVWFTAGLMALGGLLGGLNTLYAAFASRVREMATLQSLGFPRRAIVLSLIQESTLAAAVGALGASILGIVVLDGLSVRFSMGAFALALDSTVLFLGLGAGLLLGVVGALPPAWRCLRLPIPEALKTA